MNLKDTNNKTKLNILLVTPQLSIGGAQSHVLALATYLSRQGHKVSIFSAGGQLVEQVKTSGIEYICAPINDKNPINVMRSALILRQIIKIRRVDILHAHAVIPAIVCRLAQTGLKIPVICTGHGWNQKMYLPVSKILNIACDHMIVVSEKMRNRIIACGFPADRVTRIYNAIDINQYKHCNDRDNNILRQNWRIRENEILFGLVGRMSEKRKGHAILLKAFKEVAADFPEARLIFIGDGTLRPKIEKDIHILNLNNRVVITGFREDMSQVYSALDILVVPSAWEGLPMVILEAMASGKPVIASSVDSIPEAVIHGMTGLLIPPGDVSKLAEAMLKMLNNQGQIKEMSKASLERAKKIFDYKKMGQAVEQIYLQLLDNK